MLCFAVFGTTAVYAQRKIIDGQITASGEVLGVNVINKTGGRYDISDEEGRFEIAVQVGDTVVISALQYLMKEVEIDANMMQSLQLFVNLEDNVTALDEVRVGKILTGNLLLDIGNSEAKREPNFYDLGIPGYTGRRKTLSERRLNEATTGGGIVPLNPIINWITGRTKQLKNRVKIEDQDLRMNRTRSEFADMLFEIDNLAEVKRNEFFFFAAEDPKFLVLSKTDNDLAMVEYLTVKLKEFKIRNEGP